MEHKNDTKTTSPAGVTGEKIPDPHFRCRRTTTCLDGVINYSEPCNALGEPPSFLLLAAKRFMNAYGWNYFFLEKEVVKCK